MRVIFTKEELQKSNTTLIIREPGCLSIRPGQSLALVFDIGLHDYGSRKRLSSKQHSVDAEDRPRFACTITAPYRVSIWRVLVGEVRTRDFLSHHSTILF
ncbi:hypothetical protein KP509_28G016300 [Ceratopteris richardii]|uniref:Uncharacterized protein n=1 Tax=Ceratopteris richardii TaxID=49495 RepID=A0A8T2RC57_CERRI|nr:hypothetical protein KP509_28G016300 [Ceratopteris richardii]